MKRVAVCLHDLRLSDGPRIKETIERIRSRLGTSFITCHLIVDAELQTGAETTLYLIKETESGQAEVVFHGVAHRCKAGTARWLAWYHKNEAEFLGTDFEVEANRRRYRQLNEGLGIRAGICPPCWLAGKKGWAFLHSLSPLFLEKMLTIQFADRRVFSPVISLGSRMKSDLFFLKILGTLITFAAGLLRRDRIRLVVHTLDMDCAGSLDFFKSQLVRLQTMGYRETLQRNLR